MKVELYSNDAKSRKALNKYLKEQERIDNIPFELERRKKQIIWFMTLNIFVITFVLFILFINITMG